MSIVDNIMFKQDWSEDGYEFDKDAKPDEQPARSRFDSTEFGAA